MAYCCEELSVDTYCMRQTSTIIIFYIKLYDDLSTRSVSNIMFWIYKDNGNEYIMSVLVASKYILGPILLCMPRRFAHTG